MHAAHGRIWQECLLLHLDIGNVHSLLASVQHGLCLVVATICSPVYQEMPCRIVHNAVSKHQHVSQTMLERGQNMTWHGLETCPPWANVS